MYISKLCMLFSIFWMFILPNLSCSKTYVLYVVDGDTIAVNNNTRVRLLGIDTPEYYEEGYKEAKNYLKSRIDKKYVYLCRDLEDKDKYGRLLRYVFYNNSLINLELLEEGYAEPLIIFPNCGTYLFMLQDYMKSFIN